MIPLEKLRAVTHIVTHINCPDGMATAMILKDVLPSAKITFLQYDTIEHQMLNPEPGMLFCDFSPYKGRTQEFIDAGTIVLDHHKTQKAVVAAFGELGVFADEKEEPGVCGATLAFREVWKPLAESHNADDSEPKHESISGWVFETVKEFARLAGIRDTWQRTSPDWLAACGQAEALLFWPQESLFVAPDQWAAKLEIGPTLYENRLRSARHCLASGFVFLTGKGRRVIVFDGLRPTSDASDVDNGTNDMIVGFGHVTEDLKFTKLVFSTRSKKGFDCAAFCQAHGGGGHTSAAGFSRSVSSNSLNPYEVLQQLFANYEAVEDQWLQVLKELEEAAKEALANGKTDLPKVDHAALYAQLQPEGILERYQFVLDKYQRDNLVWLFRVMGYPAPAKAIEPFNYANTGDWVGQIASKLEAHKGLGSPNTPLEELQEEVAGWVEDQSADPDTETVNIKMPLELAGKIGLFKFLKDAGFKVAGELDSALTPNDVEQRDLGSD